jgi:prepilin-type N-terminal cleavage/methylation domain-containing protein
MRTTEYSLVPADAGFSLLEVLISVAILLVALASIPHLFLASARANVDAGDATWATAVAAQKIEQLVAGQGPVVTGGEVIDYLDRSGAPVDAPAPLGFVRRWSVEPLAVAPDRTMVLSVVVSRHREGATIVPESARLVTLHTRTAP